MCVVGDDDATFAGGDWFVGVEAEDGESAVGADGLTTVGAAETFAGVFDDGDAVAFGDFADFGDVHGVAEVLNDDDGFGAGSDGFFDAGGVHVHAGGVDIDEDGFSADVLDGVGGGYKSEWCGDDFVAGADAEGEEC